LKLLKAFAHNIADSYLSTMYQLGGFYYATWIYKSAMDSGLHYLETDVFNKRINPSDARYSDALLISIENLETNFVKMLNTSGIKREVVKSLLFKFEFLEFPTNRVMFICKPELIDMNNKLHSGKTITVDYPEHIIEFDNYAKSSVFRK
jgi:hypothetical protein